MFRLENFPRAKAAKTLLAAAALSLGACAGPSSYSYHYVPGRTAIVNENGTAEAPPRAPAAVRAAIAAGNRISGADYVYGGGHGGPAAGGFDCSGSASYVLRAAGCLQGSSDSNGFRRYGADGSGDWISIYARPGHVFLVVAGLRFDTGWTGDRRSGPRWTTRDRPADGCVVRHPVGM